MLGRLLLAVTLALFSMAAGADSFPSVLQDPPPLTIPGNATTVDVQRSIVASGVKRNWTIVDRQPGIIVLQYAARDFWVKVNVKYDMRTIDISYLDSSNLDYEKDGDRILIHPNYLRWVNNLAHDIDVDLAARAVK